MKAPVYNIEGKKIEEITLPEEIFAVSWNPDLVHQVFRSQTSNARRNIAHTKGRGEVSGGGKKPWRQKGTGRARHGSIRSPIWIGGGVAHGPTKDRNYKKKINRKMVRGALHSLLSKKLSDGDFKIVDTFAFKSAKTKDLFKKLTAFLSDSRPSALIVPSENGDLMKRASRNIPRVGSISPAQLNLQNILEHKHIVVEKEAIKAIK